MLVRPRALERWARCTTPSWSSRSAAPRAPTTSLPFLENVSARLRGVARERLAQVATRHYEPFGGVSPINAQNRELITALQHELDAHGPALPIYWGNRNWHPFLDDTVAPDGDDGVRRALAFVTSTFSSYSAAGKYLETSRTSAWRCGPPRRR